MSFKNFHLFVQLNKRNISSLRFLFCLCYFHHWRKELVSSIIIETKGFVWFIFFLVYDIIKFWSVLKIQWNHNNCSSLLHVISSVNDNGAIFFVILLGTHFLKIAFLFDWSRNKSSEWIFSATCILVLFFNHFHNID